ncbi:MAG: glycosyltransferase, partial [Muribaculaceae bacterium]|nr:glycosyltransferase [Muribaculaceae bacterium]
MKVTLVNHSDIVGGASMVSLRLLHALRAEGVDARMIVKQAKGEPDEFITPIGGGMKDRAAFLGERLRIFTANGFNRAQLFKVSIADRGLPVHRHPWIADADIVALNWFNQGMMSLNEIRNIASLGKPIVWTMHDMWPMTGICHHA